MIRLPSEDIAFLVRVRDGCALGYTQEEMAEQEGQSLTAFRGRLYRCGFAVTARTAREVLRTGSHERLEELLAAGLVVAADEAELAEAAA